MRTTGGAPAAGPWTDNVYFSTNGQVANAVLLGNFTNATGLSPSQSLQFTQSLVINGSGIPDGAYFVVVSADAYNVVPGPGGGNKVGVSGQAVTLSSADLVVDSVAGPSGGQFGQTILVTYVVRNAGGAAATASWSDRIYLCPGPSLSGATILATPPSGLSGLRPRGQLRQHRRGYVAHQHFAASGKLLFSGYCGYCEPATGI